VAGSEKRVGFETDCLMALQGHPRSLILAPIESAYATSCWSSIATLVLLAVLNIVTDEHAKIRTSSSPSSAFLGVMSHVNKILGISAVLYNKSTTNNGSWA